MTTLVTVALEDVEPELAGVLLAQNGKVRACIHNNQQPMDIACDELRFTGIQVMVKIQQMLPETAVKQ